MYTRGFVQWNGLGGAIHGGEGDFRMGSIRGPGRGMVRGRNPSPVHRAFCSPAAALEEPPWMSEGRVGVNESGPGPSDVEATGDRGGRKA